MLNNKRRGFLLHKIFREHKKHRKHCFQKKKNPFLPLMRFSMRHYPNMVRAMAERHIMYNQQLLYVSEREEAGAAFVIRPPHALNIGHISHNPEEMKAVYDIGRTTAEQQLEQIKRFWDNVSLNE